MYSSDIRVSVSEVTKGRGNMANFTLLWEGVPTKPIAFNASESEVCFANRPDMNYLRDSVMVDIFLNFFCIGADGSGRYDDSRVPQ